VVGAGAGKGRGVTTPPVPILFTIPNFTTAGSGQALLQVVRRLDRARFAPAIAVLKRGGHLEEEIARLGVPYVEAEFTVAPRPLWSLVRRARRAAAPFRGRGFVLWHSFHYLDDYTEPLVARFAGARAWVYTKKNMSWNRRSWLLRSILARRIAAQNTDMLRDFFGSPWLRRRARLVPRGVDIARFHPETAPRLNLRGERAVPTQTIVIGCVAQILPVKNQAAIIRALAELEGSVLWLAGRELDPGYAAELRRLIAERGLQDRVVLLGEVRDVPALLAELDLFVLPTRRDGRMEGCPVALLEAMASGRACVASNIPGSRDIVVHGESGLLFEPDDEKSLARSLAELAANPAQRRAMGAAARKRVETRFPIEAEVRAHESLYAEVLGGA
jgi:glycosyltransferase involved in cell wall biosynthesis